MNALSLPQQLAGWLANYMDPALASYLASLGWVMGLFGAAAIGAAILERRHA